MLKEVDSVYYYSHGIEPNNDFVIDTTKIHKVNGVLKLPLDNGKSLEFKDKITNDANLVFYRYEGENKKFGFYLLDRSMADWYFKLFINRTNGKIDTINNVPTYSPSFIYYVYQIEHLPGGALIIKSINTNKETRIEFEYGITYGLKWIDDKSFIFYFIYWDRPDIGWTSNKYYLVQIKK